MSTPQFPHSQWHPTGRRRHESRRHKGVRRRSIRVTLALLILGTSAFMAIGSTANAAAPAEIVDSAVCAQFDPNLVSGACMKYESLSGTAYTWIGTYRASNGSVFFCIDYLYDSKIDSSATSSTAGLRNQLDVTIGPNEVAALNYLISTHAPNGTAGSAEGNAAIALLIREVMSDGTRSDGTVVYQPGLKVGETPQPLPGGMSDSIMTIARDWWSDASRNRGPWTIALTPRTSTTKVPIGSPVKYALSVRSGGGSLVKDAAVTFACTGPAKCPSATTSLSTPRDIEIVPTGLGDFTVKATLTGPAPNGSLLSGSWSPHTGTVAQNAGVQRGWIAQRTTAAVAATGSAEIVKATPTVRTQAQPSAVAGEKLTDVVTVTDLPAGYNGKMTARLYGPYAERPTATSCTEETLAGSVSVPIVANGQVRTPSVTATHPGYYTWTEVLPGDDQTNPVETACGAVEETTLVDKLPTLGTVVSSRRVTVPGSVYDNIKVSGLGKNTMQVEWVLHGPLALTSQGCDGLDWSKAPILARGQLNAHDGTVRTPETKIDQSGCYTFSERGFLARGGPVVSVPGQVSETFLAVRPVLRISPEVPTGPGIALSKPIHLLGWALW